ncbi:MAG: Gfo/Idh/MocA family oxidoreductase [Planctomycetes bacterium]|nr:Gfo/Idh/MocA family oxidoreductase [Planctomycetota bacterium]
MSTRVGIIGCGHRGRAHGEAWNALPGCKVVAVADLDPERRSAVSKALSASDTFGHYRDLLEHARPDIVSIALQPNLRLEVIRKACEAGVRGILVEKPAALGLPEHTLMEEAVRQNGVLCIVNYQTRYLPAWRKLRERVRSGALGRIERILVTSRLVALDQGTHLCDQLYAFAGQELPQAAVGQAWGWREGMHPGPTEMFGSFHFDGGLEAFIRLGPDSPTARFNPAAGALAYQLDVWGEGGHGHVDILEGGRTWIRGLSEWEITNESWTTPGVVPQAQKELSQSLLDALEKPGFEPPCSLRHARASFEMCEALCASALERRKIEWPLPAWEHSPMQALRTLSEQPLRKPW